MEGIQCVVFDLDGVLTDSNAIKQDAYLVIFQDVDPDGRLVRKSLLETRGEIRHSVIATIIRQLQARGRLESCPIEELVLWYAQEYNRICEAAVSSCPEIPGCSECLKKLSLKCPLYVNSATPEEPLRRIVRRRGWERYFRAVLGAPRAKLENLRAIGDDACVEPAAMVFVGDQPSDREVASAFGCRFVGMQRPGGEAWRDQIPVVADLYGLMRLL